MSVIRSVNPATGVLIREIPFTPAAELTAMFARARKAQEAWAALSPRKRAQVLIQLRETIINRAESIIDVLASENGKPRFEALANEVVPAAELITHFAASAPRILADHRIPLRLMKHRVSYLQRWPLGVVAVISPWNYPFLMPLGDAVMALVAGNAVIFKPSEATTSVGLKIQELMEEAGVPSGLFQTAVGDGTVGAEIVRQKPDKIFFTGSVATGKKIMAAATESLTPVSLELGGKDAMIVLPDADLDYATSAALWGAFSNAGQICASVERLIVHHSIADEFERKLVEKMKTLRAGVSAGIATNDIGPATFEPQKKIYERHLSEARQRGAKIVGGEFDPQRRWLAPSLVSGPQIEELEVYNEETFGPVVAMTTFRSIDEAIEKANRSRYGLLASVITRNIALGESVARRLEVGTVTINEVTYTAGLPETPWGGMKDTGFGKKHSDEGLLEFVRTRHIHKPRASFLTMKSWWWFPYTPFQYAMFQSFLETYRRSWIDKLKALPHLLVNLVQFLKNEKRL
jgi:acyl-CoA reductase-like NAD-dependent aldehyde dehydrogenase